MDEHIYMHTLYTSEDYDFKKTQELFEKILRSNAIFSKRFLLYSIRYNTCDIDEISKLIENDPESDKLLNSSDNNNFCGMDYISLSDFEKRDVVKPRDSKKHFSFIKSKNYNAYHCFVKYNTSIILQKGKFEVYEPTILEDEIRRPYIYKQIIDNIKFKEERFTDLEDEVQAKDYVSLNNMIGLMVPCISMRNFWLRKSNNLSIIKYQLEEYRKLLLKYEKDVPIYDSKTFIPLDDDDSILECYDKLSLHR